MTTESTQIAAMASTGRFAPFLRALSGSALATWLLLTIPAAGSSSARLEQPAKPLEISSDRCERLAPAAKLSACDLAGRDLRGVDLRGADLRGANLSFADLEGADLSQAWLDGANLSYVHAPGLSLALASVQRVDLRLADLTRSDLSRADFRESDLSSAVTREARTNEALWLGAVCPNGTISKSTGGCAAAGPVRVAVDRRP